LQKSHPPAEALSYANIGVSIRTRIFFRTKTVRVLCVEKEFDLYRAQKQKLSRVQGLGMTCTVGAKIGSSPIHSQE
jgi:hypothetical protein